MKVLSSAEVSVTGGRNGQARSRDGAFEVKLSVPRQMGGTGELGTNPEQLFAAGYKELNLQRAVQVYQIWSGFPRL